MEQIIFVTVGFFAGAALGVALSVAAFAYYIYRLGEEARGRRQVKLSHSVGGELVKMFQRDTPPIVVANILRGATKGPAGPEARRLILEAVRINGKMSRVPSGPFEAWLNEVESELGDEATS